MATITKRVLSGSTHGVPQAITATQGLTAPVVHALSTSATTTVDEIWLYGNNEATAGYNLILEWGVSSTTAHMICPLPARSGPTLIMPGMILTGSACAVSAFVSDITGSASTANTAGGALGSVTVFGWVNRIVQT
jgi:hypothetical protein